MASTQLNLSLDEMVKSVADGLKTAAKKPSVLNYVPHAKQEMFHRSSAKGRLYVGGNRSGKTVGGAVEAIYYMKGQHPYKRIPESPTNGRIITVDFKKGAEEIILPQLKQWIPPSLLKNGSWEDSYNGSKYTLTLANGSRCEIMSHEQPVDKFAGTSRNWLWMDEECPKSLFTESKMRLLDVNGDWWLTMTPVEGMTWIYDELYMPHVESEMGEGNVDVIVVDIAENPHIPTDARLEFLLGLTDEERKIRAKGEFVALGGLLLKQFSYKDNVIEFQAPPLNWEWWVTIDHGFRNPAAIMWNAISPSGGLYTFREHYREEWTVAQHCKMIKSINAELGREPDMYIGDLAMTQRTAVSGHSIQHEYRLNGINVTLAKKGKGSVGAGIDKMNEYLRVGKWQIADTCINLIKEIRKYRAKPFSSAKLADNSNKREEPNKKDDHAIDSVRYGFTFMPQLGRPTNQQHNVNRINAAMQEMMGDEVGHNTINGARIKVYPWQVDPNFGPVANHNNDQLEYGEIY